MNKKSLTQAEFKNLYKTHAEYHKTLILCDYDFSHFDFYDFDHSSFYHQIEFYNCNLQNAHLDYCILSQCEFHQCNLLGASFKDSILKNCIFSTTNMHNVNFRHTFLLACNFFYEDLSYLIWDTETQWQTCMIDSTCKMPDLPMACPRKGSFIGYKKCAGNMIAMLEIPADAKRSSALNKKCRCDKAKVLDIWDANNNTKVTQAYSRFNPFFKYHVGEMVSVHNFDKNRYNECAAGIHFFMDKQDAIHYTF